nr:hypothetical protein GCM10020063_001140 [Dactylosporangium thailandense]
MRTSKFAAGVVLAALLAVSSACGSDSADKPVATDSKSSAALPTGTSADESKSPVTVGFHNLEGGSISLPDVRIGFEAGVKYVNERLGGINGHPLEAIDCKTDGSPEASVNCANRFVEKKAVLAVQGADFGADAMLPVLKSAGLAELGSFPLTPGMNSAVGDAFFFEYSAQEGYAGNLVQLQKLHAEKIAVLMVDNPASHETYDKVIEPAGKKLGLQAKVFYVPAQSDWTVQAATVLAWKPDAIAGYIAADALAALPAFRTAGFRGYFTAGSNVEIIPQLDASVLKKTIFNSPYYLPEFPEIPKDVQPDIDAFNTYAKSGIGKTSSISQRQNGFYVALVAARALTDLAEKADPLTAEAVHRGLATSKGDRQPFRTNGWDCSKPSWPGTTACGTGGINAEPNDGGLLVPLSGQPVDISAVLP